MRQVVLYGNVVRLMGYSGTVDLYSRRIVEGLDRAARPVYGGLMGAI